MMKGNNLNNWNYISEVNVYGIPGGNSFEPVIPDITIYPNPASDFINVSILDQYEGRLTFGLYDLYGRLRFTRWVEPGITRIQIPSQIKSGVYIARVMSGKKILFSQKQFVQR